MERDTEKKEIITKMRPEPDFRYLAQRASQIMEVDVPLARKLNKAPGKIPGFYAQDHGE